MQAILWLAIPVVVTVVGAVVLRARSRRERGRLARRRADSRRLEAMRAVLEPHVESRADLS